MKCEVGSVKGEKSVTRSRGDAEKNKVMNEEGLRQVEQSDIGFHSEVPEALAPTVAQADRMPANAGRREPWVKKEGSE